MKTPKRLFPVLGLALALLPVFLSTGLAEEGNTLKSANAAFEKHEWQNAASRYEEVLEGGPDVKTRFTVLAKLGAIYANYLTDMPKAIAILEEAWSIPSVELDDHQQAERRHVWRILASLYCKSNRPDDAEALIAQFDVEKHPKGFWRFMWLQANGDLAAARENHDQAIEHYLNALKEPDIPDWYTKELKKRIVTKYPGTNVDA